MSDGREIETETGEKYHAVFADGDTSEGSLDEVLAFVEEHFSMLETLDPAGIDAQVRINRTDSTRASQCGRIDAVGGEQSGEEQ